MTQATVQQANTALAATYGAVLAAQLDEEQARKAIGAAVESGDIDAMRAANEEYARAMELRHMWENAYAAVVRAAPKGAKIWEA